MGEPKEIIQWPNLKSIAPIEVGDEVQFRGPEDARKIPPKAKLKITERRGLGVYKAEIVEDKRIVTVRAGDLHFNKWHGELK